MLAPWTLLSGLLGWTSCWTLSSCWWFETSSRLYDITIMTYIRKAGMAFVYHLVGIFNTLKPRQNGRHFADDTFKCVFVDENIWIAIDILLKFVPYGPINNIPALVQIMAWCRPGDKPLSEPIMVRVPTHICVTRPQWVKSFAYVCFYAIRLYYRHACLMFVFYTQCVKRFLVFALYWPQLHVWMDSFHTCHK